MNTSSNGSSSSKDSNILVKAWKPVTKAKTVQSQTQNTKGDVNIHTKPTKPYVSIPTNEDVDIINSLKTKVCDLVTIYSFESLLKSNFQGPKKPWVPKFFQ